MASSSSSPLLPNMKYDVFLSFRGEDTRNNFTSHLYHALQRKKIKTFMDHKLNRGEEISQNLIDAIRESKISVIVFSENYADSKWCLNELLMILDCRDAPLNQIVMPVFYNVDPKDVRNQTGIFGSGFHTAVKKSQYEEARWRSALKHVCELSGWHSSKDRPEAILVDTIVDEVSKQLRKMSSNQYCLRRELVGMNSRIEKVLSLLCIESPEFRMVGIWGMGGVGKTTLAEEIFHKISCKFASSYFLQNVRENAKKTDLVNMRNNLISKLLKEDKLDIGTPSIGDPYIKNRLRCTRVLVVIDDVDDSSQLEVLTGGSESVLFGLGSRVIVTSRDKQVLTSYHMARLYNMETLQDDEALQLFRHYAFHPNQSPEPYLEFSKIVVEYAKGVALPLKVLGSSLRGKTDLQHWESALGNLKEDPNMKILDVLKISYDGLNTKEKDMFLDIACFFKGNDIDFVTRILDGCYPSAYCCIDALIDKSLITISQNKKLEMHDLLQDMGWNIVSEESKEPGSRSRLWRSEDVCDVLTRNTGTEKIKGIFFDVSQVNKMDLDSQVFAKMCNLKFLNVYHSSCVGSEMSESFLPHDAYKLLNQLKAIGYIGERAKVLYLDRAKGKVRFPNGLKSLPDELRYLSWFKYPLKCFPSAFCPGNLVELDIVGGSLERLWTQPKTIVNLKALRLEGCKELHEIPDLSSCTNLEELDLSMCSMVKFPSSIKHLNKLERLSMTCTTNIEILSPSRSDNLNTASSSNHLPNLKQLSFTASDMLDFPSFIGNLNNLTYLYFYLCSLREIPSLIGNLNNLTNLVIADFGKLVKISPSIGNLVNLTKLEVSCCPRLVNIPSSIGNLNNLTHLNISWCSELMEIPSTIGNLNNLIHLDLTANCKLKEIPSTIGNLNNLTYLDLSFCVLLLEIPSSIGNLNNLRNLRLSSCVDLREIPIKYLNNLICLDLTDCVSLVKLPNNINLASLTHLYMRNCITMTITEFPNISTNIKVLEVDMTLIGDIPLSIQLLTGLQNLTLWNWNDHQMPPLFLENLKLLTPISCNIEIKPKEVTAPRGLFELLRSKWSRFKGRLGRKIE